jgi:L-ascorbate metabolism protein UlaG (beta-lactamase superfamily)
MQCIRYSGPDISKNRYLSHQKNERFFSQTLPSFFASHRSKRGQDTDFFNQWVVQDTQQKSGIIDILNEKINITWLGHASFLIQLGEKVIITDPVFGHIPLFSRLTAYGIEKIPPVDVVLLSHNHPDHMDDTSLMYLAYKNRNTAFLLPFGDKRWLYRPCFSSVSEHSWYDKTVMSERSDAIIFTFLPSYHWSRRSLFDTNVSLWGSWLIQWKDHAIYFGGDSAYFDHFAEIGSQYKISVALLPIAPIAPTEWMMRSHMSPEMAGKAFFDLGASMFIPMHWGTFHFGIDQFQDPVNELLKWKNQHKGRLDQENKKIKILKIGEILEF